MLRVVRCGSFGEKSDLCRISRTAALRAMIALARGPSYANGFLCQHRIETALPGDITPLTSPMMFHEVARHIFRLEWRRDRGIAVWTSIGANPQSGRDVRFFAERQRPIHSSLPAVVAAFSRRFGRPSEPLIFCRFGAIIFGWTHAFPPASRGRERTQCLSATDGPDFFLILVVRLRWGRLIPIASLMRTPRNVRGLLLTKSASYQGVYS
jgi:hypothetical protein